MKKVSCEICGSTDLIKNGDVFICQCCECRYSVEEVRKMVMDDKQQRKTLKSQSNYLQGRFGDNQVQPGKEKWICPECETINTDNRCVLCGYKKAIWPKKRIWIATAAVLLLLSSFGFIAAKHENETDNSIVDMQEPKSEQETLFDSTVNKTAENPTYGPNAWKENELKRSPDTEFDGVVRDEICSVTFLDTLVDAPEIVWDVSKGQNGSVLAWIVKNGKYYDLYIAAEGGINAANACKELFARYFNLREIRFNDCFHTEQVTDMSYMFKACRSLSAVDLCCLDTSKVANMSHMFENCSGLNNLDVSGFDTSHVTDMSHMFSVCSSMVALDVSTFDTSNVTNMSYMFNGCHNLASLNISGMDTHNVTDMSDMFSGCSNVVVLDVGSFDTSKVTNMSSMFNSCKNLKYVNVTEFDTSLVEKMQYMFWRCNSLESLDISNWKTFGIPYCFMDEGKLINGQPWERMFE